MSGITEEKIQLGLALFAIVQRGLSTLKSLKEGDPDVYAEIERRHANVQVGAQAALDAGASQAGSG